MKKFITAIPPMQREKNLSDGIYKAANNERLQSDIATCFPVFPLASAYAGGEEIEFITIYTDDERCIDKETGANISAANYERFKAQAKKFFPGGNYKINEITIKYDESAEAHLGTFTKILEQIDDGDIVFADITFGTKPLSIIEIMALGYALRVKENVAVECLSYGAKDFNSGELKIYDITSLLFVDELINNMTRLKVEQPLQMIKDILKLGE